MNKLLHLINSVDYNGLLAIQKDLAEGNLGRIVAQRISAFEKAAGIGHHFCTTCGISVDANTPFILIYGQKDFRKKAAFCGHDCLIHFVQKLSKVFKIH